jgi:signal transduction histidine kinase
VPRRRALLALWIYLAGLAQLGATVIGFLLFLRIREATDAARERDARAAVETVASALGDAAVVRRELDRVLAEQGATITIEDEHGSVLATSRVEGERGPPPFDHGRPPRGEPPFDRGPPPGPPPDGRGPEGPPPDRHGFAPGPPGPAPAFVMTVRLPGGGEGRAIYARRGPPPPRRDGIAIIVLALVAVGVVSLLLSRSLARPLARLSGVARAFGAGKLDARARLRRSDEIGDVAAAFDEMAERVTTLLRSERELLANVSHELRTPLARIRVALEIAEEGDAETAREALGEIGQDLAELDRLIGDILTAARLDLVEGAAGTGLPPLRRERCEVGDLLDRAASRFRSAHPDRALVVTLAPGLPAVDGDPVLLRRVVDNLLENAHKYSPRTGSEVRVEAAPAPGVWGQSAALRRASPQRPPEGVRIEVEDRGAGIAPEDVPHVFRPFFRADRSRSRATGGLGLGLALARRIVEAHEGTIAIDSRLGEGTRVVVLLPAALNNR